MPRFRLVARWLSLGASLGLSGLGCGDPSGTLPEGQPFDAVSGYSGVPTMQPGVDCQICHAGAGRASARVWSVAGTVFAAPDAGTDQGLGGVQVLVTDSKGKQLTLTSNAAGNFYTAEPLADLVDIEVQRGKWRLSMNLATVGGGALALVGSCNRCHVETGAPGAATLGVAGAPGRLFVPGP